ncbi:MAG: hypothetical protein IJH12_01140 [Clostridia bacterium]|nr:hypothetical protein [Clostridia bacterium]
MEKLIQSERQFNDNVNQKYKVSNWFENLYNENKNAIFVAKKSEKVIGYIYVNVLENNEKAKSLYENVGYNKFELKLKKEL